MFDFRFLIWDFKVCEAPSGLELLKIGMMGLAGTLARPSKAEAARGRPTASASAVVRAACYAKRLECGSLCRYGFWGRERAHDLRSHL